MTSRPVSVWLSALIASSCALGCGDDAMTPGGLTGAAGSNAPACSGKPGAIRGRSLQMLVAGGLNRSFVYYAPATLDPNAPAPIVIVPHGYTMNGDMMFDITGFAALADTEKFIAIFPNGQAPGLGAPWNVGMPDCQSTLGTLPIATGDDDAFIDAMIAFAEADQCVDKSRVYMTGFSMGGYLSNATGCKRSDIRAIGPHSAGSHDLAACPVQTKPVILTHFEGDSLIPYSCGTAARDRWIQKNGCQLANPDVTQVMGGRCEYYKGCAQGGQVAMCSFPNPPSVAGSLYPGHGWAGGSTMGTSGGASFAIPDTASATQLTWDFFKQYAW